LAAPLMRAFKAPTGVKVVGRFEADDLCATVVKACRAQCFHVASTRKSPRRLCTRGWTLTAGGYGRHLFRRRRPHTRDLSRPDGPVHDRFVKAGWLQVSTLDPLHVVFSRTGIATTILGLVTDAPTRSAPAVIRTYDTRWTMEPTFRTSLSEMRHL
jgi:hypothetical protein